MERQTVLMGVAVMVLTSLIGFYIGFLMDEGGIGAPDNQSETFSQSVNYTVGAGNDVTTARFDNQSIDLFHEDGQEASFYIDTNQDGSADTELENLQHDGQIHTTTETVILQNRSYRLYFRYQDSAEERGDAQLWLYHVEAL